MRTLVFLLALGLVFGGQGRTLVATTPIVADILGRICGERFQVVSLIPLWCRSTRFRADLSRRPNAPFCGSYFLLTVRVWKLILLRF